MTEQTTTPMAAVERLQAAINAHDLDALVACFSPDFLSVQPAHPGRTFRGAEQVRQNWQMILGGVPDLHATLVRSAVDGGTVWAEWEWSGTRRDGGAHEMRGVTVQGGTGETLAWANFYMEVVDPSDAGVSAAIRAQLGQSR